MSEHKEKAAELKRLVLEKCKTSSPPKTNQKPGAPAASDSHLDQIKRGGFQLKKVTDPKALLVKVIEKLNRIQRDSNDSQKIEKALQEAKEMLGNANLKDSSEKFKAEFEKAKGGIETALENSNDLNGVVVGDIVGGLKKLSSPPKEENPNDMASILGKITNARALIESSSSSSDEKEVKESDW
jgi:hypothetical protein